MICTARYLTARLASIAVAAVALATVPRAVSAQTPAPSCFSYSNCVRPPKAKFNYLCMNISDRTKDPDDDSPFVYRYERTLWEMVGAQPGIDSLPDVAARIRVLWQRYHDDFVCDTSGLSMGRVLAYSIHNDLADFLRDALEKYHLDANVYDSGVKGTVLDYVDGELARLRFNSDGRHTPQIEEYEFFRDYLVKAGVKHWSELSAAPRR